MPKEIIWSPLAENDFALVLEYLNEEWNNKVVLEFIDLTDSVLLQISINPKLFPIINRRRKIRKCVITKHNTLYYRENKSKVDLLRVFDTRQRPKKRSL